MKKCPICDGDLERRSETAEFSFGKRKVSVHQEFSRCLSCQEEFFTPEQMDEAQRRAAAAIREREELLQPERIRELRERLGLTQAELEALLRVGEKTVVRWEGGAVFQNRATDTLLRVLERHPNVARDLAKQRGIELEADIAVDPTSVRSGLP